MRTNVNIADDARQFAEYYAQANGITLGEAISALILSYQKRADTSRQQEPFEVNELGIPVLRNKGRVITTEMVRAELEDLL
jgi:hypothetical protein